MLKTKVKEATRNLLIFPFDNLHLALQLEGVLKVIPLPEIFKSGNKLLGIAHFEDREAIVIDLYQKIYDRSAAELGKFLVIVQTGKKLYGIPIATLPTMKEVAISTIDPVPTDYRDRDTLGIASHMAQIPTDKGDQTVFLLDPERLLDLANAL